MLKGKLGLCLAATLAIGAQAALAQVPGLPAETSAREAADAQLQNNINAEAAARGAADSALRNTIDQETAARALGEAQLQGAINAEAAARAAADATLRGSIDSEAGARAATDTQLQMQIDQLRSSGGGGGGGGSVTVDCTSGGSLSQALATAATQITVRGTCSESVNVNRDDVTLLGEPGATISGPDATVNTINVRGNRVTIDGLTVTGGRNGITGLGAANLTLRNCTVQSTGRNGISYANGSNGTIDRCTVQSNARDGIAVDGAQATITNSTVMNNRNGILVVNGGTSRIGISDRFEPGANTISQNGATGVSVSQGGSATIAMNTISGNGTNATSPGRSGIGLFLSATASIAGGNTISGNAGPGVSVALGSSAVIGDPGQPGVSTTVNTISGNGNATSPGGVSANLGSSIVVRDAVIESNNGYGLILSQRAQGQLFGTTIRNNGPAGFNPGDGIRLAFGSALLPFSPPSTVSGNSGFGIQCTDGESSIINTNPPTMTISGNSLGDVSAPPVSFPGCSAF